MEMTMSDQISVERVLEVLEQVVAREGADTRRECKYVVDDAPHCVGGTVLFELGVPLTELKEMEGRSVYAWTDKTGHAVNLSTSAGHVLRRAQIAQDDGLTWGDALVHARAFVAANES
jgi:hypothetical protein